MNRVWHRRDPTLFEREKIEVEGHYPQFHVVVTGDLVLVRGTFPVIADGVVRDRYSVEIHLAQRSPEIAARRTRSGGTYPTYARAPHQSRWRRLCTSSRRAVACLASGVDATCLSSRNPFTTSFLAQSLVERGDQWPFGQWGHGADGVREYYEELLHTADLQVICRYLTVPRGQGDQRPLGLSVWKRSTASQLPHEHRDRPPCERSPRRTRRVLCGIW